MRNPFARRSKLAARPANPYFGAGAASRANRLPMLLAVPPVLGALLLGAVTGLDAPLLLTLVAGALFALLATFLVNSYGFMLMMFAVVFVGHGTAMYFGGLLSARWVATGMGILFTLRVMMDMSLRRYAAGKVAPVPAAHGVLACTLAYLACYLAAIALNRPAIGQLFSAAKSNLPMFSVLATFMWSFWKPERIERLWKLVIWIALLQFPVAFYQHFFVMTQRRNGWDSVVGTFGGTPLIGGLSSMLALFVICAMTYALARWNRGLMSGRNALLVCMVGVATILLGEVKASFLWFPLCTFVALRKRIMKNLFTLVLYGLVSALLLGIVYYAYKQIYWSQVYSNLHTRADVEKADNYFFDPNNVNYRTGEVSRGASIAFWVNDKASDTAHRLVGNGPNSSKSGGPIGDGGPVAMRFKPLHIDASALAVLLWDVGLVGTLAYLGIILSGIWTGWRLLRREEGSARQLAALDASTGMLFVFLTTVIYNRTLLDEPTTQLLFFFCLGCIVQTARYRVPDEEGTRAPLPAANAARMGGAGMVARPLAGGR